MSWFVMAFGLPCLVAVFLAFWSERRRKSGYYGSVPVLHGKWRQVTAEEIFADRPVTAGVTRREAA
ncbi:hypothetical protein [Acetobacter fallax]|uniref:Uncharacterized protein n=1 Tax=Acetobacter fallax TaxID=1737473 RepID=A0ABX0KDX3_9PROT|nr:hypothetical protein [Acetobacter fallax]NHO33296.1 hypothetical protein [Acetobacter fallax]NHO36917.1 hypothetical protein [Acetobacter fallax]